MAWCMWDPLFDPVGFGLYQRPRRGFAGRQRRQRWNRVTTEPGIQRPPEWLVGARVVEDLPPAPAPRFARRARSGRAVARA